MFEKAVIQAIDDIAGAKTMYVRITIHDRALGTKYAEFKIISQDYGRVKTAANMGSELEQILKPLIKKTHADWKAMATTKKTANKIKKSELEAMLGYDTITNLD